MHLTEHKPGNHYFVRAVEMHRVLIGDQYYDSSLIVGARLIETNWPIRALSALCPEHLSPMLSHQPELILLGAGTRQQFASREVLGTCLQQGVGLECMTLEAACQTFNILMSENRRVIMGLIFETSG
jgi:uncharacterized protein